MGNGLRGRKIFFCVNPRAGGGRASTWWQAVLPELERLELEFFWGYSGGGVQTSKQVREAVLFGGASAVVAVGGDGHIHDVLNGLVEDDKLISPELVLGLYPAGSGCDFARMIYINGGDTNSGGFIRLLQEGEICRVDLCRADFMEDDARPRRAYFLNGSDVGLGAETCLRVNAEGGKIRRLLKNGQLVFLLAALQALMSYRCPAICVEVDGERLDGRYLIAAAGNGRYMGGNMCLFPRASLSDGLLDVFLVPNLPKLKVLALFAKVYNGTVLQIPEVIYRQAQSVSICPEQPLALELDGELPGLAPYSARVLPAAFSLLCFAAKPA